MKKNKVGGIIPPNFMTYFMAGYIIQCGTDTEEKTHK